MAHQEMAVRTATPLVDDFLIQAYRLCDHDAEHVRSGDPIRQDGSRARRHLHRNEREQRHPLRPGVQDQGPSLSTRAPQLRQPCHSPD